MSEDLAIARDRIANAVAGGERVQDSGDGIPHVYAFQLTHEQWKAVRDRLAYADALRDELTTLINAVHETVLEVDALKRATADIAFVWDIQSNAAESLIAKTYGGRNGNAV